MRKIRRSRLGLRIIHCALAASAFTVSGCIEWDGELARRFRTAYGPGLIQGLSTALTDPTQAEAGFRLAGTALLEGLGAIIEPRSPVSE